MPYVLKKGNHYCFKDADNTINKVPNVKSATMFANEKHAQSMLLKCSKKLKGFEIVDLDTIDCDEKSNTVDKSKQTKEKRKSFNTPLEFLFSVGRGGARRLSIYFSVALTLSSFEAMYNIVSIRVF